MNKLVQRLRTSFQNHETKTYQWRKQQLENLLRLFEENDQAFKDALKKDLGRSYFHTDLTEMFTIKRDIKEAISNLKKWMKPTSISVPISDFPGSGCIEPVPLGVVLIIGAWNFPLVITACPLIGAIAAGNCAVVKPSEMTPETLSTFAKLFPKYMDERFFQVVEGGPDVTTDLLNQKFDHIFFTGSEPVGKIIYQAAAKQMTPVTLELGGKSPVIVDETANLELTARRLLFGKVMNCGQICIAPDYVLVKRSVQDQLMEAFKKAYREFFPNGAKESNDLPRIVNNRHFDRLDQILSDSSNLNGEIILGGEKEKEQRFMAPTIFKNTDLKSKLMEEEIFGPLLPCLPVNSIEEAIQIINDRPRPLSVYLFSESQATIEKVGNETCSGAFLINDVVVHYTLNALPFGGVGSSGFGKYRGKHTFDTFSHFRSRLHKSGMDIFDVSMRYPPYTENKQWAIKMLL